MGLLLLGFISTFEMKEEYSMGRRVHP